MKVIFVPGNGGGGPNDHWFPYLKKELEKQGIEVIASEFPDNQLARAKFWIPFLKNDLKADGETILIGHSSGAIAAMRFAEENQLLGTVLVSGYHTDLGMDSEKQSGYFDKPWDFDAIKKNQKWIVQFAATDDPWIPIEESRFVHKKLNTDYHEFTGRGHFNDLDTFPELLEAIQSKI